MAIGDISNYIIITMFKSDILMSFISDCTDCLLNNTLTSMCNNETTICLCKERFTGSVCEKCMPNYDGYPKCESCSDEHFGYPLCEGMFSIISIYN